MTDDDGQEHPGWVWSLNKDDVVQLAPGAMLKGDIEVYYTDEAAWKALMVHHANILVSAQKQMKEATERLSDLASSHAAWAKKRNKT